MIKQNKGLSLVEVVVVLAIAGIVAAVAWPVYDKQSARNRRTDAVRTMLELQTQLERCFYSADAAKGFGEGTFEGCGYLLPGTGQTPEGYYALAFTPVLDGTLAIGKQGVGYTLTATRVAGGVQDVDTDCDIFSITNTGQLTATKADASSNDACWGSK